MSHARVEQVLYTAAHGGFSSEFVPLGGGAAVADALVAEWTRTQPFRLVVLDPQAVLGTRAPRGRDLVRFSEREYARFCEDFERAATAEIVKHDPARTAVLVNDVSEAPDFAAVAARGFDIHTIYHVDVVAYVAAIYARGWLSPAALVKVARAAKPLLPAIARLVFDKQVASVRHSRNIVVPSARMRDVIASCYPWRRPDLVRVLPWGTWAQDPDPDAVAAEMAKIRHEFAIAPGTRVLLTLSRISPEKGQDRLLAALLEYERRKAPASPMTVFVCGEAAFMMGERHLRKLREMAARFRHIRVHFPGYVSGVRKAAFFRLADLYVFPSRHESYGLTLVEALHAGLPAVCLEHHGADEIVDASFGCVVNEAALAQTIDGLLADPARLQAMGAAAREYAKRHDFAGTAAALAKLIRGQ